MGNGFLNMVGMGCWLFDRYICIQTIVSTSRIVLTLLKTCLIANLIKCHGSQISVEEVKERQDRLAKMRSLLFRHELKAKHIKKIKSKSYHRLKKKDKLKAASSDVQTDPDAAKELAEKQERKRAEV